MELHPEILSKNGKPEFVVLPYEEFMQLRQELSANGETKIVPDPRYGGFFDNLSAEELAKRQNVKLVQDFSELAWPYDAGDWDGFEEAVEQWRNEQTPR